MKDHVDLPVEYIGLKEHLAGGHEVCQDIGIKPACVHHEIHDLRSL
jgi:hypothetical protein